MPHSQKESARTYFRNYKRNHRAMYAESLRRYRAKNPEKVRAWARAAYWRNAERKRARAKELYHLDVEKSRLSQRLERARRRALNPKPPRQRKPPRYDSVDLKIIHRAAERIRLAVKGQSGNKAFKTAELLGCSVEFLRLHLESLFKPGMTWDNYGISGWHIDHIKPCSAFDLKNPEQQKQCFHHSNLQPLWWHENLRKGASASNYLPPAPELATLNQV